MVAFEANNLCRYFRAGSSLEVRAVDRISFHIAPRSFVVLSGPSGSGKTTLLALLGALERPTQGTIRIDGSDITVCSDAERTRIRRRLGFVFQSFALIPRLPVWENITYPLIPRGIRRRDRYELATVIARRLAIGGKLARRPEELSGGERQRVAVARAIAVRPDALLADEPTSNLDPDLSGTLRELLVEISSQGTTVIVATHDADLIRQATQVLELRDGSLCGSR